MMISPQWWLTVNILLIVFLVVGGFFMFRGFLRRIKNH